MTVCKIKQCKSCNKLFRCIINDKYESNICEECLKRYANKKLDINIKIVPNNYIPAFAGWVNYFGRSWLYKLFHRTPKIVVNFNAMFSAMVENDDIGITYKEFFAENVVHEMLHMVQDIFGQAFDEDEVEEAIMNCRKELNNENI